jgi:hypothetical protein
MPPLARRDNFIVREMPDETLVYETRRHKAHCLNRTAAVVWRNCDGNRSVREIASIVEETVGSPVTDEVVQLAIDQLGKAGLLESGFAMPSESQTTTRRNMLGKLGLALSLIPVVASVTAPKAQAAASTVYIPGPTGPAGANGTTGATGPTGPTGPAGSFGSINTSVNP